MGRSEADSASATSWAVQCSAALGCDAAVLRSAVGASTTKVRALAMRSERLSAPLDSRTCACSRRTPPRTSRRGAARAQRCYDKAAPGRGRRGRTRTARAIPPLQRYGRWCDHYHRAALRRQRAVGQCEYSEYPRQGTPVTVLRVPQHASACTQCAAHRLAEHGAAVRHGMDVCAGTEFLAEELGVADVCNAQQSKQRGKGAASRVGAGARARDGLRACVRECVRRVRAPVS
jgi:hypothetical protein